MSEFIQNQDARRNRILEAGLAEFAEKGYKKASTNTIVRQAKVSKGLLFHYFVSKEGLFIFIVEHAIQTITQEMMNNVNFADRDVLRRVKASTLQKIESYNRHPQFTKLFEKLELLKEPEMKKQIAEINEKYAKMSYDAIFNNIDYYLFKDNLTIDRSIDVIKWTVDRISQDWRAKNRSIFTKDAYDELVMDINNYLELFREAFYK